MMIAEPPLSRWAQNAFGERATLVRRGVGESLTGAMGNAQDAQKSSKTSRLHPFGFTLMSRKFESLISTFGDMDDVQKIKPAGSPYELVVINGNLLYPFRYAKDRSINVMKARVGEPKASGLVQALFNRFGPEPTIEQLVLVEGDGEQESQSLARSLAQLPEETKLLLVAYACNAKVGLLDAWWGEAELLDKVGNLYWHHCEEIPLPKGESPAGQLTDTGTGPVGSPTVPKFDQGAMPTPSLNSRPSVERVNGDAFPPASEAPSAEQNLVDDEGQ